MYHGRYDVQIIIDYEYIKDKIKDLHWKEQNYSQLSDDIIIQILAEYAAVLHGTAKMSDVYLTVVVDPPYVYICPKKKNQLYADPAIVHIGKYDEIDYFDENNRILCHLELKDYNNVQATYDAWDTIEIIKGDV